MMVAHVAEKAEYEIKDNTVDKLQENFMDLEFKSG